MAADIDDVRFPASKSNDVAVFHRHIYAVDPVSFGGRGDDPAAGRRLDRCVAACVIGMPVGVPDLGDLPALLRGLAQIGLGIGGIDAGGLLAFGIVQKVAVIVGQARELVNFEHGHGS